MSSYELLGNWKSATKELALNKTNDLSNDDLRALEAIIGYFNFVHSEIRSFAISPPISLTNEMQVKKTRSLRDLIEEFRIFVGFSVLDESEVLGNHWSPLLTMLEKVIDDDLMTNSLGNLNSMLNETEITGFFDGGIKFVTTLNHLRKLAKLLRKNKRILNGNLLKWKSKLNFRLN